MMSNAQRWTDEEWQRCKSLLDSGIDAHAVAQILGRTVKQVRSKHQWMTISDKDREHKAAQKRWRRAQHPDLTIHRAQIDYFHVPERLLAEREERELAQRTITGILCGDPPPGWSALDRRGA
jgi:hypothetical protein